jgi:hypothetical protein
MAVTTEQLALLAEIFYDTERSDKISLQIDSATRTIAVTYEDLDDGWFGELIMLANA